MNLNSVADINSVVEYVNNHTEKKLKPEYFYNKQLSRFALIFLV